MGKGYRKFNRASGEPDALKGASPVRRREVRKGASYETTGRNSSKSEKQRYLAGPLPYLRHSAATILLGLDAHPKVVQELLGHSQIAMIMDTYSHVLPTMQKGVMERLDDVFGVQP